MNLPLFDVEPVMNSVREQLVRFNDEVARAKGAEAVASLRQAMKNAEAQHAGLSLEFTVAAKTRPVPFGGQISFEIVWEAGQPAPVLVPGPFLPVVPKPAGVFGFLRRVFR